MVVFAADRVHFRPAERADYQRHFPRAQEQVGRRKALADTHAIRPVRRPRHCGHGERRYEYRAGFVTEWDF